MYSWFLSKTLYFFFGLILALALNGAERCDGRFEAASGTAEF
jgi:hypothetical protein